MRKTDLKRCLLILCVSLLQTGCGNSVKYQETAKSPARAAVHKESKRFVSADFHGSSVLEAAQTKNKWNDTPAGNLMSDDYLYGNIEPSLSENLFAHAIKETVEYDQSENVTHTYIADYDGDGESEAYVITGKWLDSWGRPDSDMITGTLWLVDSNYRVTNVMHRTFSAHSQYIQQDGRVYLFLDRDIGLPWTTEVLSVQDNECVNYSDTDCIKRINGEGQVVITQDTYDMSLYMVLSEDGDYLLFGHTWKPYVFAFDHGQWAEVPAREVMREEVEAIAAIPASFDQTAYDAIQYILRDNGELNINMAEVDLEFPKVDFHYNTYRLGETKEWEFVESNRGFYRVQLSWESHWDYLDQLMSVQN